MYNLIVRSGRKWNMSEILSLSSLPASLTKIYQNGCAFIRRAFFLIITVLVESAPKRLAKWFSHLALDAPQNIWPRSAISPHLASPRLASPHLTSPHLTTHHITSPSHHIISSHLISSCLISQFNSLHLTTSSSFTSPHLTWIWIWIIYWSLRISPRPVPCAASAS